jgi:hypothetical protein
MQVYRNCLLEIMIDQRLIRFQDLVLLYLDYIDVVAKGVLIRFSMINKVATTHCSFFETPH